MVHTLHPFILECFDSFSKKAFILLVKEGFNRRYDVSITAILASRQVFLYVGEQMSVRYGHTRRIRWVMNRFKANQAQQPLKPRICVYGLLSWWNKTPSIFQCVWCYLLVTASASSYSTLQRWRCPFEDRKHNASCIQKKLRKGTWQVIWGVYTEWIVSLTLPESGGLNAYLGLGNLQGNQLDLTRKCQIIPWCDLTGTLLSRFQKMQ